MIKLTPKEAEFLKKHKEEMKAGNISHILSDADSFGDPEKLKNILKQFGYSIPIDIPTKKEEVKPNESDSTGGIKLLSINLPTKGRLIGDNELQDFLKYDLKLSGSIWTKDIFEDGNPANDNKFIYVYRLSSQSCDGGNYPNNVNTIMLPIIETNDLLMKKFTSLKIADGKWLVIDDNHIMLVDPLTKVPFDIGGELDYEKSDIKMTLDILLDELRKEKIEVVEDD